MIASKIAYGTTAAIAALAAFAGATYRPVQVVHNDICPTGMGGGNDRDYPVMFTTNGDMIDYHYPRWWERWYSRGGIVIDRVMLMDCNNFRIHWRTRKEPIITIPAHGTVTIPIATINLK